MNIIKLELDFRKEDLDKLGGLLVNKVNNFLVIEKKIKIDNLQYLILKFKTNISDNNINVIITLKNILTKKEEIVKEFYHVCNYYSLNHICFKHKGNIYIINTNINSSGISGYSFDYTECIEEINSRKDTYMYILFVLFNNNMNINLLGHFICSNIQLITKVVADFILQKLDYLGFDEIYSATDYKKMKFSALEFGKTTKDMMSFLIYCLRCISHSTKNIYTYDEISKISKTIVAPF